MWLSPWLRGLVLFVAAVFAIAGSTHAFGALRDLRLRRLLLRLGWQSLWLTLVTAWLWLLTWWPLTLLAVRPSLGASLLLSLAAGLAVATLWQCWPWAALPMLDVVVPGANTESGSRQALSQRSQRLATAAGDRPMAFMVPVAVAQMLLSYLILAAAGLMPWPPGLATTWPQNLWVVALLMVSAWLIVWRVLAAGRVAVRRVEEVARDTPQPDCRSLTLAPEETMPGRREQELLEAARAGDVERALALLAAGADPAFRPDAGEADSRSVLVLATLLPGTRLLRALIARGVDVNGDGIGTAPLLLAVRDGRHDRHGTVAMLLANGADVRVVDAEGNNALHFAALADIPEVAATLFDAGALANALNQGGMTPLALACRAGNEAMLSFLLERKACLDVARGVPALIAAAGADNGREDIVQRLLQHGAAVNVTDVLGRSALLHAALAGNAGIVKILLAAGADPDQADQRGTTTLMEAARAGCNEALEAMVARGADPAGRDGFGRDALLLACQSTRADADTVRHLLALGADPHAPAADGRSALDHAAAAGRWKLVAAMDPDTPLPAAHADDYRPEDGADSPAHLLDALRFGHWATVSGFASLVREWPAAEVAGMYPELLAPQHAAARQWLWQHGLDGTAHLADGRSLMQAVVDALPDSIEALDELLARGLPFAGRGTLARALWRLDSSAAHAALAHRLIEAGADMFGPDEESMAPLHCAATTGQAEVLENLLARGCDPNVRDRASRTPLHLVLQHEDDAVTLPLLQALLCMGADPEAADASGETPLGQALHAQRSACVEWLRWSTWTLPRRPLRHGDLPRAAAVGDTRAVTRLLDLGLEVDATDAQGATALLRAAGHGHLEVIRALLDAGADVTWTTPGGATALTAAVTGKHEAVVALLLERGAEPDQRLRGDVTALMVAAALGLSRIATVLLEAGASAMTRDQRERTALHAAAQFCFRGNDSLAARRILDTLLQHGADIECIDNKRATPLLLMLGARERPGTPCDDTHLGSLIPCLLDAGADVNAADDNGVTALHACAIHALLMPMRQLLARGADRRARDSQGRTPADVAHILGFVDVAHELRPERRA